MLSDALGEVQRGLEVVEFACGIPHLLKGGVQRRASRPSVDVLLDPPAARRGRGDLAVQLPGDGAAVVLPGGDRVPATPWCSSPARRTRSASPPARRAVGRGRAARRRVQRRARGQGGGRPAARRTPTSRRSRSSARRRSRATSTRPAPAHGKRVQALGGAKNHMVVLPDADLDLAADAAVNAGFGSAGERCMAISVAGRGRPGRRRAGRRGSPSGWPGCAPATAARGCDMGPLVTGAHRDKVGVVPRRRRRGRRRPRRRRARRGGRRRRRTGSGSGRRCSTT